MFAQKYGRPNEATPAKWNAEYTDFGAPAGANNIEPVSVKGEIPPAPIIEAGAEPASAGARNGATADSPAETGDTKKRKRHEDETPEERAERKRKKKEKKEKRKSKGEKADESD